jgi:hypothetical protein
VHLPERTSGGRGQRVERGDLTTDDPARYPRAYARVATRGAGREPGASFDPYTLGGVSLSPPLYKKHKCAPPQKRASASAASAAAAAASPAATGVRGTRVVRAVPLGAPAPVAPAPAAYV